MPAKAIACLISSTLCIFFMPRKQADVWALAWQCGDRSVNGTIYGKDSPAEGEELVIQVNRS